MADILPIALPPVLHEQDGEICIVGRRLTIVDILFFYREGYTPEMIVGRYNSLPLATVYHVIAFYLENQQVLDTYLDDYLAHCEDERKRAMNDPAHTQLRDRLLAMRKAQRKATHAS